MFTRLECAKHPVFTLKRQYRMHPDILEFPNKTFYNGIIESSSSVVGTIDSLKFPLVPYKMFELESMQNQTQQSHVYNTEEVEFVVMLISAIRDIVKTGKYKSVQDCSIGVITPYVRQRDEILKQIG